MEACSNCGGALEWPAGVGHPRCTQCQAVFTQLNGILTPAETAQALERNRRAGSRRGWGIGAAVIGAIVLGVFGVSGLFFLLLFRGSPHTISPSPAAVIWEGQRPLVCTGNDRVEARNITAYAGITATGNCHVGLINVDIIAPVAITATNNARVAVTGGSLTGSTSAILATNNAQVVLANAKVAGDVTKSGNAHVTGLPGGQR